ncbi:MAG: hypothetical protein ACRC2T_18000 [Thermoguttaceae bacterium]
MFTFLTFLMLFAQPVDAEELQTYIRTPQTREVSINGQTKTVVSNIDIACEFFPKQLTVGDMMYVKITTKNITDEPLECFFGDGTLGSDRFISAIIADINASNGFGSGKSDVIIISRPPICTFGPEPKPQKTLQPNDTMVSGPQCFILPLPENFDHKLWTWDDLTKEEKILITTNVFLSTFDPASQSLGNKRHNAILILQELKIKPRQKEELNLIKKWYEKTNKFSIGSTPDSPTAVQWLEFEEKLTPGTLRNYIHMVGTIVKIKKTENTEERQKLLDEMSKWTDELNPLEKEGLTKLAEKHIPELKTTK